MVVEKLNLELIEELTDRTPVGGVCLLQTYQKLPTKNGGSYIGGTLSTSDGSISFKAWGNSDCFKSLDENDLKGSIIICDAEVNIYNGQRSLIVSGVRVLTDDVLSEMGLSQVDFMYSKYNVEAYWEKFDKTMEKNLSANAYEVFNTIMEKYSDRFKEEFAAMYHHDNCRGGLIAHSLKVVQIATIVSLYPNIMNWVSKDLLYLGCALHDIGKIVEYSLGDMSDEGKAVSHPVIGAVMLATEYADLITEKLGERFFYELLSVVSSHHGDMGERPRTVAAYVVHKLDMIEALFTGLNDQLEDAKKGEVQQYDGYKLS